MSNAKSTFTGIESSHAAAESAIARPRLIANQVKRAVILVAILSTLLIVTLGWMLSEHQTDTIVADNMLSEAINVDIELVGLIKDMKLNIVQVQQWLTDISATRGLDGLDDGFVEAESSAQAFNEGASEFLKIIQANKLTEFRVQFDQVLSAFPEYYAAGQTMAKAYVAGGPQDGNKLMADFDSAAAAQTEALDALAELVYEKAAGAKEHSKEVSLAINKSLMLVKYGMILTIAFMISLTVFSFFYIRKTLLRPLTALSDLTRSFAEKNYDQEIPHLAQPNEIGILARALASLGATASEVEALYQQQQDSEVLEQMRQKQTLADQLLLEEQQKNAEEISKQRETEQQRASELAAKVDDILNAVEAAIGGNLTPRVMVNGDDAIGRLGSGVQKLLNTFSDNMRAISGSAVKLSESSSRISSLGVELGTTAKRTSQQSGDASAAAQQISGNVENVATATEQMSSSIGEIALQSDHANTVVSKAVALARSTDQSVRELSSASTSIGDVAKVIASIAEQTNLLALNATIEAARAGDAGKGFAVVASEVKELANETAKATNEIGKRIASIQNNTNTAVGAIADISDIIQEINGIQSKIASAIVEQSTTMNQISHVVAEAAQGSALIAVNISDVASEAEKSLGRVGDAQLAANELSQMSDELNKLVSYYR